MATASILITAVQGLIRYTLGGGVKKKVFAEIDGKTVMANVGCKPVFSSVDGKAVSARVGLYESYAIVQGHIKKVELDEA